MHMHENANGIACEIAVCNAAMQISGFGRQQRHRSTSPAAGVITPRLAKSSLPGFSRQSNLSRQNFLRSDGGYDYRRSLALEISAELRLASASCAEISAVCAGVPQLGASLPSPQARGR